MNNEKLLERLKRVTSFGFDVDDLLVTRNENTFHYKLEFLLLTLDYPQEITNIADVYRIKTLSNFEPRLHEPLSTRLMQIRRDQTVQDNIRTIVADHYDDTRRTTAILNLTGTTNSEDFWISYGYLSRQAGEDSFPLHLLAIPSEGSNELLEYLIQGSMHRFVFTNSPINRAFRRLEVFPTGTFDREKVFSAHTLNLPFEQVKKPSSLGLRHILTDLGIQPDQAIYLGNGVHDVQAAYGAEMLPVLVLPTDIQVTNELPPHIRVSSLAEFHEIIA